MRTQPGTRWALVWTQPIFKYPLDGDRLQGQVQCRGPRLLGHKSEHRVRPCVHDIFSSSGGVRIHRFMHDVKFMFQNGVWQGEME